MPLSVEERAQILVTMLNPDKPHGKSAATYAKETPDLFAQTMKPTKITKPMKSEPTKVLGAAKKKKISKTPSKASHGGKTQSKASHGGKTPSGGLDLTVNYGDDPKYALYADGRDPGKAIPYTEGLYQTASLGVMGQDPEVVATMYSQLDPKSKKKIDKMMEKKGKEGFIHSADLSYPVRVGKKVERVGIQPEKIKELSQLEKDYAPIVFTEREVKHMVEKNKNQKVKNPKAGTRKGNPKIGEVGTKSLVKYREFLKKIGKEPFYQMTGRGSKKQCASCVYELLKELHELAEDTECEEEKESILKVPKQVIEMLNHFADMVEEQRGGGTQPALIDVEDVIRTITQIRKKLNKQNPRIQILSKNIQKYSRVAPPRDA